MVTQVNGLHEKTMASQGKVRWREYESILVAILLLTYVTGCIWKMLKPDAQQLESDYVIPAQQVAFSYTKQVLLPQVGTALLLCLAYYGINWIVIPVLKKISLKGETVVILRQIIGAVVVFCVLSWLLALGINAATYYAHPWLFNYRDFQLLALLGYNDHPLENLWTGFDRALWLLGLLSLVAGIREVIVHYVERPGPGKAYRVLVLKQITIAAVVYCSLLAVILLFNVFSGAVFRITYAGFIPATFLVFMVNTYWLFPQKEGRALFSFKTLIQLLLSTFLCTFLCFLFDGFAAMPSKTFIFSMICWGIQLFVTTPISWLIYQQRRDRILQLRGVEEELSKSKANLQFLRSQINPHFLFNALNTLYGTALREKASDTATGIQQLGDMMRFMLHENNLDFIPMSKEIEYLQHYIALQKLRIQASPDIVIEHNIGEQSCHHQIAPMLLIPFVENAFKHGISLREQSWIHISLICEEKHIRFALRNSVHPRPQHDPETGQSGIGLQNVLDRLALVYPGRHTINISNNEREFLIELSIQP
ncbi:histidine kinase [Pseudoflavitalea sp. X16]|uniref:sensor histidine kinase n=1 Tax=Paraflavitalea devenefica TaxID=2716334 RepID=UPI00141FBFF7|nr:histidine kinase [Paraflavitalea devenefica]NII26030.1 histidine kinase [Paraflavitalea devenefica]